MDDDELMETCDICKHRFPLRALTIISPLRTVCWSCALKEVNDETP